MRRAAGLFAAALAATAACASAPKNERKITKLYAETMRVRRPTGESAIARPLPGGSDSRSNPPPDERFDCVSPGTLHTGLDLKALRACLDSPKENVHVTYALVRDTQPRLKLMPDERTPPCLKAVLPEIAVPREIFFQSPEHDGLQCYASRLDVEADRLLGSRFPKAKYEVVVDLPLAAEERPRDDGATQRMLVAWSLTPFFTQPQGEVSAVLVSERHCRLCLGEGGMIKPGQPPLPLWP